MFFQGKNIFVERQQQQPDVIFEFSYEFEPFKMSFFEFFSKIKGFIFYVTFVLFPLEQFFPSESIGEGSWPLFLDESK